MKWRELARLCEADGWAFDRQHGSHRVYVKDGVPRPIVIPRHQGDLPRFVVSNIKRQLAESRRERRKPK
ncbi:MAG: type II toxin-antitoxin system HicA family toxin [Acidobacteria bacterium]|nr:type II toxin-antitoxin system HicA family toxin [Acidobacteriota bacterium]